MLRDIPIKRFLPDWDNFGKSAGLRRNDEMSSYADVLLLIWDGESRGSSNMKHFKYITLTSCEFSGITV